MESNRPLRKVCPQCDTTLHVKRAVCGCRHTFPSKRKAQCTAKKEAMKCRRIVESQQEKLARKEQDRVRKERMRTSSETHEQTMHRREQDRLHKQTERGSETHEQTMHRREQDRLHKESKKALEMHEQKMQSREQDRLRKQTERGSETHEQTMHRREQDRLRKQTERGSETHEQTMHRREQDRLHKVSKKALEMHEQKMQRRERIGCVKNPRKCLKHQMKFYIEKRTRCVPLECAISAFHSDIKSGPDFVCTCCYRMMYRKSVVQCNKSKYTKASPDVLQKVFSADLSYISNDGKEWMCKTCNRALIRGSMPLQAKANGLVV